MYNKNLGFSKIKLIKFYSLLVIYEHFISKWVIKFLFRFPIYNYSLWIINMENLITFRDCNVWRKILRTWMIFLNFNVAAKCLNFIFSFRKIKLYELGKPPALNYFTEWFWIKYGRTVNTLLNWNISHQCFLNDNIWKFYLFKEK